MMIMMMLRARCALFFLALSVFAASTAVQAFTIQIDSIDVVDAGGVVLGSIDSFTSSTPTAFGDQIPAFTASTGADVIPSDPNPVYRNLALTLIGDTGPFGSAKSAEVTSGQLNYQGTFEGVPVLDRLRLIYGGSDFSVDGTVLGNLGGPDLSFGGLGVGYLVTYTSDALFSISTVSIDVGNFLPNGLSTPAVQAPISNVSSQILIPFNNPSGTSGAVSTLQFSIIADSDVVPEPSTVLLIGIGLVGLASSSRR